MPALNLSEISLPFYKVVKGKKIKKAMPGYPRMSIRNRGIDILSHF